MAGRFIPRELTSSGLGTREICPGSSLDKSWGSGGSSQLRALSSGQSQQHPGVLESSAPSFKAPIPQPRKETLEQPLATARLVLWALVGALVYYETQIHFQVHSEGKMRRFFIGSACC